jgi:hypothetical protein
MQFDLRKFQTQKELYNKPTDEELDNVDLILFGERFLKYSVKHWCDDLENIIKKEFMIK